MEPHYMYIGVCLAAALIALAGCYGISKIASTALEAMARQPEAAETIKSATTTPLAFLEASVIVCAAVCLLVLFL